MSIASRGGIQISFRLRTFVNIAHDNTALHFDRNQEVDDDIAPLETIYSVKMIVEGRSIEDVNGY